MRNVINTSKCKNISATLLIITLFFGILFSSLNVQAEEITPHWTDVAAITTITDGATTAEEITPRWTDVATITTYFTITDGVASMEANARAYNHIKKVSITVRLQQYYSGDWHTIATYNPSNNRYYCLWSDTYYSVSKGYNYRIWCTVKAYESTTSTTPKETIERYHEYYY